MKSNPSQMAVMNVNKGEEIIGGWATMRISQIGIYKLLAKKRKDGVIEWAHFIQRDDGTKDRVMRGEVDSRDQLDEVVEIASRNLKKLFGVALQVTDYDMSTLDGKKASDKKQ